MDAAPIENFRNCANILDTSVGAGAYEYCVDLDVTQLGTRREIHVIQCLLCRGFVCVVGEVLGAGDGRTQRQALPGVGSPGDKGGEAAGVDVDHRVEHGVIVCAQAPPISYGIVPVLPSRRVGAAFEIIEGGVVGGDHAGTGARFDRHVADGHAGFHRQLFDGLTAVFDDVTLPATGTDLGDDGQNEVFGCHAGLQFARDVNSHGFEGLERQGLGG